MGLEDTPTNPESERIPEPFAEETPELGEELPELAFAATTSDDAEETDSDIAPADDILLAAETPLDESMSAPPKKTNMRLVITAGVFALAIAVFAVVYFVFLQGSSEDPAAPDPVVQQSPPTPPTPIPPTRPDELPVRPPVRVPPVAPPPLPVPPQEQVKQLTPEELWLASLPKITIRPPLPPVAAIPDPFVGGPPPPVVRNKTMTWSTVADVADAVERAKIAGVQVAQGKNEHEVILTGKAELVRRVLDTIIPQVNVPPPPEIVVASLPSPYPTASRPPNPPIPLFPVVPLEPPVGRHAGWVFNSGNGQIVAIFEDRAGVAHTVKVGDEVDGLRVLSITPTLLTMVDERNKQYTLKLQGLDTSQSRTPQVRAVPGNNMPPQSMPPWRNN